MTGAVSLGVYDFTVTNTFRKDVLNFASVGANSNKFYMIELQEGTGDYTYCIHTQYGRLGKNPRNEYRYFRSRFDATSEYDRIVRSKETKGYRKVEVDDGFGQPAQITVAGKTKPKDLSSIGDKVLRLIGKLYTQATNYLVSAIDTPLGKLSTNQVGKGIEVLGRIEELLDKGVSGYALERLTDEFYSIIPVSFGSRVDYQKFLIDDYSKLNEKKDLLGVMSSVVQVQDSLEKTLEDKYKALNIKLKALSNRTKEYKRVVDKIKGSHSSHHRFSAEIKEIYQIENMVGHDKFNPLKVETMELFHGTRNENILSIFQNSLKIKPKSAVHSGSMYGAGIYSASESSKSMNYSWGFGSAGGKDEYYMFICEVATGKIKDYDTPQPQLTSAPRGYNSVRGVKGKSLLHDEYIVYKESQVRLTHIIEFKRK